jgi:hypothetical protein
MEVGGSQSCVKTLLDLRPFGNRRILRVHRQGTPKRIGGTKKSEEERMKKWLCFVLLAVVVGTPLVFSESYWGAKIGINSRHLRG